MVREGLGLRADALNATVIDPTDLLRTKDNIGMSIVIQNIISKLQ